MLTKTDLVLLLSEFGDENSANYIPKVMLTEGINAEVLKYVNDKRQLDVAAFYSMIRKNYNNKKSALYKNLVKEEFTDAEEVLTTLSALNLQIILYAKKLGKDNQMFLKHSRGEEITRVLNNYYKTYDLIPCFKLLKLIKADLKAFENLR